MYVLMLNVEPQSFANAIWGFIVILGTDCSKSKSSTSAKFPVLIRRRKKENGTNLITADTASQHRSHEYPGWRAHQFLAVAAVPPGAYCQTPQCHLGKHPRGLPG